MLKELFTAYLEYIQKRFDHDKVTINEIPEVRIIINALRSLSLPDYLIAMQSILDTLNPVSYRNGSTQLHCYKEFIARLVALVHNFPTVTDAQLHGLAEIVYTYVDEKHKGGAYPILYIPQTILAYVVRDRIDAMRCCEAEVSAMHTMVESPWYTGQCAVPFIYQVRLYQAGYPIENALVAQGDNTFPEHFISRQALIGIYFVVQQVVDACFRLQELVPVVDALKQICSSQNQFLTYNTTDCSWCGTHRSRADTRALILANYLSQELYNVVIARDQSEVNIDAIYSPVPSKNAPRANKAQGIFPFFREATRTQRRTDGDFYPKEHAKLDFPQIKFNALMFLNPKTWRIPIASIVDLNGIIQKILAGLTFNLAQNGRFRYSCKDKALWIMHLITCIELSPEKLQGSRSATVRQLAQQVVKEDMFIITL